MKTTIRFDVTCSTERIKHTSVFLNLPKNVTAKFPKEAVIEIEGSLIALPFRSTIERNKDGNLRLRLNKLMQGVVTKSIANTSGKISIEITKVNNESETRIPADFQKVLNIRTEAKKVWTSTTAFAKRDWIFWMITGKKLETRALRIEKALDMLALGKRRVCCFPGVKWMMEGK